MALIFSPRQLWPPKWLPGGTRDPPGPIRASNFNDFESFFHVFGIDFLYVFFFFYDFGYFFLVFLWILTNICGVATDFLEANSSRALLKKCIAVFALAEIHASPPI